MPTLSSQSLLTGAISLMHRSSYGSYERAESLLSALIDRHGRHPLPYAWSAKQHLLRSWRGWSSDAQNDSRRARDFAERALQASSQSALALAIRGMVFSHVEQDFASAARCYDAAIAASPNESLAWLFKSTMHSFCGEGPQAMEAANRALVLSPLDPLSYYYQSLAASAALTNGDLTGAITLARNSVQLNRMHLSNYRVLAIAYGLLGDTERARPIVSTLLEFDPRFTVAKFLERSPGARTDVGEQFAAALRFVGVPA
jgi:tetratricopeptide (TPR) repeat protein